MSLPKIALVFGGRSPEHEVSVLSAASVLEAVDQKKYEMIPLGITTDGRWVEPEKSTKVLTQGLKTVDQILTKKQSIAASFQNFLSQDFTAVFPLIHGPGGEDGTLQGFFELLDIPYVGPGVLSSALGMDKAAVKKVFAFHKLPQADFMLLKKEEYEHIKFTQLKNKIINKLELPLFVKPANMGSSIGISKVNKSSELEDALELAFDYDHKLVLEENVLGRELECSVLGGRKYEVSQPGEIKPDEDFYDYQAKYEDEQTKLIIPAQLKPEVISQMKELAAEAFQAIDGYGLCRVDFFLREKDQKLLINELNTLPGFTEYSMYPKLWSVSGLSYPDLIDRLITLALNKEK